MKYNSSDADALIKGSLVGRVGRAGAGRVRPCEALTPTSPAFDIEERMKTVQLLTNFILKQRMVNILDGIRSAVSILELM